MAHCVVPPILFRKLIMVFHLITKEVISSLYQIKFFKDQKGKQARKQYLKYNGVQGRPP